MNKTAIITLLIALLVLVFAGYAAKNYFGGDSAPEEFTEQLDTTNDQKPSETGETTDLGQAVPGDEGSKYELPLLNNLGKRGVGNPLAPVVVREFFSLTCNHCANFHKDVYPALKERYIDTGKIYFIFEEFPLNGPALYGSMIARCMPEERYGQFITLLLENQDQWAFGGDFKTALKQNAALTGMGEEEFEACFNNKELQQDMATNIKNASENWKISSTPSFVFNDGERILRGAQNIEQFERVYNHLVNPEK